MVICVNWLLDYETKICIKKRHNPDYNLSHLVILFCSNYYLGPLCAAYLHNLGLRTSSRTLRFADEVWLRVCAAETLVPLSQAPIAVRCCKTHTVTLFTCEVARRGGREDNKLAPFPSSAAAVLKTSCIIQTWKREMIYGSSQRSLTMKHIFHS